MKNKLLIRNLIPKKSLPAVKKLFYGIRGVLYKGDKVICPCCGGHFKKFLSFGKGEELRKNAICPKCNSLERHRLIWIFLKNKTNLFSDNLKVLHFAPEYVFQTKMKSMPNLDYLSADIEHPSAMIKVDITNIPFKDNIFDVILCNYVLQEVPNDKKAMKELYRVLKKQGWAILQSFINHNQIKTDETFKTGNAIRRYGNDYKDKLENAGFKVRVFNYSEKLEQTMKKYGLPKQEKIYFCTK